MSLLESFLRSRGNLKEMERELGISYPTVRGRVDALVRALGLAEGEEGEGELDEAGAVAGAPEAPAADLAALFRVSVPRVAASGGGGAAEALAKELNVPDTGDISDA